MSMMRDSFAFSKYHLTYIVPFQVINDLEQLASYVMFTSFPLCKVPLDKLAMHGQIYVLLLSTKISIYFYFY